jgi:hypothetical protein
MSLVPLSEKAADIIATRPTLWEHALLGQVICDEVARQQQHAKLSIRSRKDYSEAAFSISSNASLSLYMECAKDNMFRLKGLITRFSDLLAADNVAAFGPLGMPGDAKNIVQLSQHIGEYYADALAFVGDMQAHRWTFFEPFPREVSDILTPIFTGLRDNLLIEGAGIVRFYEEYGPEVLRRIREAVARSTSGKPLNVDLAMNYKIKFEMSDEMDSSTALLNSISATATRRLDEKSLTPDLDLQNASSGFLYLLMNPSMPGLVKIGKTTRSTDERARELGGVSGVPTAFTVVFEVLVRDCHRAEKFVHERLGSYRVSGNREFFQIAPSRAIEMMLDAKAKGSFDD